MSWSVLGIDLSLNHSGFVELDAKGNVRWFDYVTDKKSGLCDGRGVLLPIKKGDDRQQEQLARLAWWRRYFIELFEKRVFTYVGIEDYAFHAQSNTSYQIGEVGGVARLAAVQAQAYLRLHDPMSVKLFAAGAGTATGHEVAEAVKRDYRVTLFAESLDAKGRAIELAIEDLSAAYVVARMVWTEVLVRSGKKRLDELEAREVRVFNRCTKSVPVNLLGREFLEA
jgi:Holliday junction resolvasome RuvABC endonuclease subunit